MMKVQRQVEGREERFRKKTTVDLGCHGRAGVGEMGWCCHRCGVGTVGRVGFVIEKVQTHVH